MRFRASRVPLLFVDCSSIYRCFTTAEKAPPIVVLRPYEVAPRR
jgi:hypothetical protein